MAENDNFDNENDNQNDNSGNQSSGKGLRAQLEQTLSRLAEIEKERDDLRAKTRSVDLAKFLKSAGAKDGAEVLYPKDAEVSEDAVKAWVEQNAAFVRGESQQDDSDQQQVNVSEESRVNAQRLAALVDSSTSRPAGDLSQVLEQINAAKTPEELQAIYATIGLRRE